MTTSIITVKRSTFNNAMNCYYLQDYAVKRDRDRAAGAIKGLRAMSEMTGRDCTAQIELVEQALDETNANAERMRMTAFEVLGDERTKTGREDFGRTLYKLYKAYIEAPYMSAEQMSAKQAYAIGISRILPENEGVYNAMLLTEAVAGKNLGTYKNYAIHGAESFNVWRNKFMGVLTQIALERGFIREVKTLMFKPSKKNIEKFRAMGLNIEGEDAEAVHVDVTWEAVA